MNVEFRRMQNKDVPAIYKIEVDLFEDSWSKTSFVYEIKNKSYSYPYVLIENENLIGYCVCWYFHNELHIGNFAVNKTYQGQGFGKVLMQKIFELFPDYNQAFLEVKASNNLAISLYLKFGFEVLATRKSYYANGEDALAMIKYK